MTMRILATCAALLIALLVPTAAGADGRISVTLPDGNAPKDLFTDLTLVPGDTVDETLLVSQNTDESVRTGIRFEALSPAGPLHESAEVTMTGFGESVTVPLGEALGAEAPFWLGGLEPDEEESLTISVHLPQKADNDTRREQARFRVIVTAQAGGPPPTSIPTEPPGDPTADTDSSGDSEGSSADSGSADATGSDSSSDSRSDSSSDAASDSGAATDAVADTGASDQADSTAEGSSDPGDDLPRTGVDLLLSLAFAAVLLTAGVLAIRAGRRSA